MDNVVAPVPRVCLRQTGWKLTVKKLFDKVSAIVLLIILSPLLLSIAVVMFKTWGRPVPFRQFRHGLNGRPFHLIKFRTMTELRDLAGQLLLGEMRLTRVGRFLIRGSEQAPSYWILFPQGYFRRDPREGLA